jgi:hypothetical protein
MIFLDSTLLSSVCFFILVNGDPSSFFNSFHGLRWGGLSSFLFVIAMEALSRMLYATFNGGFIFSFFFIFFLFYVGEPLQGRALWTHPCKVNLGPVHRTLRSFPTRN